MDVYAMVLYAERKAADLGRLASSLAPSDPGAEARPQQPSPEYWVAASAFCALSSASTGQVGPPLLHASQLPEPLHPGHISARQPLPQTPHPSLQCPCHLALLGISNAAAC